jgi:PAS domain S-box-containing protein
MKRLFVLLISLFFYTSSYASNPKVKNPEIKTQKITLQLLWKYQFEFAGFIAAKEKGFYQEEGLDVELKEFEFGMNILKEVKENRAQYALSSSALIKEYVQGEKIKLLANYFKRSPHVIVTHQNIILPIDLIGKKLKVDANELKESALGELLKKFKITKDDLTIVPHDFSSKDFIEGKIDAMSAFITNETYHLKKHNIPFNIMDPTNYGIINYGGSLFTSLDEVKKHPKRVQKFIQASKKGWEYAITHKEEIVDIIYDKYSQKKSKEALLYEANEVEKLLMLKVYELGKIDQEMITKIAQSYVESGSIPSNYSLEGLICNISEPKIDLTKEQKAFLLNNRILKVHNESNWPPYNFNIGGIPKGYSIDYMNLVARRLGIQINYISGYSWSEFLQMIKRKEIDVMLNIVKTPQRSKTINFTKPYATPISTIFSNFEDVHTLKDLSGKKVCIPKDFFYQEHLQKDYPDLQPVLTLDLMEAIQHTAYGTCDAFLSELSTATYLMEKNSITSIKYQVPILDKKFSGALRMGIRSDMPMLKEIIEKAMEDISDQEIIALNNKWFGNNSMSIQKRIDEIQKSYIQDIISTIPIFIFIIFIIYYWYRREIKRNEALKKSNENFERLLSSTIEAIAIFRDGLCIEANETAVKMFGYANKDEVLGRPIIDFVAPDSHEISKEKWQIDADPYEANMLRKDGSTFPALVQGKNKSARGEKIRISAVIDISQVKEKEFLLAHNSKMAAMGEMIGNIAHQWRQPLSAISSLSSSAVLQIQLGITNDEANIDNYKKIIDYANHLSRTVDDFRYFLKEDKEMSEFDIKDALNKDIVIIDIVYRDCDIELVSDIASIKTSGMPNELSQAVLNILNNAKDAIVSNKPEYRVVFVRAKEEEGQIKINIKDSAGGVPEHIMDKVFEPYFTTKHQSQGTGIGLYMTREIIIKHLNGDLSISNESYEYKNKKLKGANFCITIPIKK